MKRFLIGLLAVGLIAAFSMPAIAANITVSGEYFAAGYWENNSTLKSSDEVAKRFYAQRLQVNPVIQVAEGLKLITRFEALERVWGQTPVGMAQATGESNARNTSEEQNISWRRAYIDAKLGDFKLNVGYMRGGPFGTNFMDYENDVPKVAVMYVNGPFIFGAQTEKAFSTAFGGGGEKSIKDGYSQSDYDKYNLYGIYKTKNLEVGGLVQKYVLNMNENKVNCSAAVSTIPFNANFNLWIPYVKATFGPLYVEGEILYVQGAYLDYKDPAQADIDVKNFDWYLKAKYTMGPAYLGGMVAVVQGDDPTTSDKVESAPFNPENGYVLWQPTLVLFNDFYNRYSGNTYTGPNSASAVGTNGLPTNVNIYQVFAGYKPIQKLDLYAAYSVIKRNEKPSTSYVSTDIGNEFDITATYKIYDNLSYMVGFGYLWVGDYFKGTSDTNTVGNDWLLMHKLTLTF